MNDVAKILIESGGFGHGLVVLRSPVDKVALGIYASELALWVGIMIAGLVYNVPKAMTRRFRSMTGTTTTQVADETRIHGETQPEAEVQGEEEVEVNLEEEQSDRMSVFSSIRAERRILPRFRLRDRARTRTMAN